ncbi:MAG TPA: hypothetical protein VEL76_40670, partial [Gemmataceae bacterium]|nr:hypothetical protein [Gemmataceae bacterium]
MDDYPKAVKRQLRELAAIAHERELRTYLERLEMDFAQWRAGRIDTWELSDRIHRFHQGPSRDLFVQYTGNWPDMVVAHALVSGLLKESEVTAEVLQALARPIAFYRSLEQDSKSRPE